MKKLLPVYGLLLLSAFACKVKEETKAAPEIDDPINYADNYFLEALIRKETMIK